MLRIKKIECSITNVTLLQKMKKKTWRAVARFQNIGIRVRQTLEISIGRSCKTNSKKTIKRLKRGMY